jgi:murein DD-endopeptidase MepM/ murein hydrolase activator NlpD
MKIFFYFVLTVFSCFLHSQWACYPLSSGGSMVCGWGCYSGHQGQDWQYMPYNTSYGKNIYAVADGVVVHMVTGYTLCDDPFIPGGLDWAQPSNLVIIYHPSVNLYTRYVHIANVVPGLAIGSQVTQGQVIAYIGNVGPISPCDNTNPQINAHLHFEVGTGVSGNGLTGKFNPVSIFNGCYPPFCCKPLSWTETACTGIFQDTGGPNATYSNNESYTMTIAPPNASKVVVNFYWIDIESGYDYLYAYDGPSTSSPLIGVYTGTINPGTIISSSGSITFRFVSDNTIMGQGWNADWYCVYSPQNLQYSFDPCPKISLNFSWQNSGNNWYVDVSEVPTFSNFWNRNVSNTTQVSCPDQFYNIFFNTLPLTLQPLKTYYWRMWNGFTHTSGGSFTVPLCFTVQSSCSGTFYDTGGPNGNYSSNEDYHILIQPPGATQVSVTLNAMDLHPAGDTLWFYNGNVSPGTLLGKFTGTTVPGTLVANSGTMVIRFKSDFVHEKSGWSGSWQCSTLPSKATEFSNIEERIIYKNHEILIKNCEGCHTILYNMMGQELQHVHKQNDLKENLCKIPLYDLPEGLYILKLQCDQKVYFQKFLKK